MIKAALLLIGAIIGLKQVFRDVNYLEGTSVIYDEYDFVIVGGGSTGLVVANRLSEDSNTTVLVIEAGESDYNDQIISTAWYMPLTFFGKREWNYKTVAQESSQRLFGKKVLFPTGKVLGGTSSINGALYLRSSKHDFNSWVDKGADGWSWEEIKPLYQKVEHASDPELPKTFGKEGNVKLSRAYQTKLTNWLQSAAKMLGYSTTDTSDGSEEGVYVYTSTVYRGNRQTSAVAYFWPVWKQRLERLHIIFKSLVKKVLFETNPMTGESVAVGVQYSDGSGVNRVVRARKEVIICAGAIGTPHLLLHSGIGPKNHLDEMNIDVVADSPGVGSNLQDHVSYTRNLYSDSLPDGVTVDALDLFSTFTNFTKTGYSPLNLAGPVTSALLTRTKLAETDASLSTSLRPFPEMIYIFTALQLTPINLFPLVYNYLPLDWTGVMDKAYNERNGRLHSFMIQMNLLHPKSTGTVRLENSDPHSHPLIDPKYLSHEDDVKVLLEGFRFLDTLLQTPPFSDYNLKWVGQPYCDTEENNRYPKSEEFYRCLMRSTATSEYHPCCTAKMGADNDPMAVLDSKLRVKGVQRLRVADASVMPHEVSGNTVSACYIIGEKASEMIKKEWTSY